MPDEWKPCRFIEYPEDMGDPRYSVMFDDFGNTQAALEANGFMGGGYTWHGIVEALIRKHNPEFVEHLNYDPESSMFCARSSHLDALRAVSAWIERAMNDEGVLQDALDHADDGIIE